MVGGPQNLYNLFSNINPEFYSIITSKVNIDSTISTGDNRARKAIYLKLKKSGANFTNVIHYTAIIENNTKLGDNVFVGARTYININSVIGDSVFINNGYIIEHDNIIKSHTHICPGVVTGGTVSIGNETLIGLGACVNDHIKIGNNCTIGSGSVVIDSISSNSIAVGVPAKIITK